MNSFDQKLKECGRYPLEARDMSAIVVIMGNRCNLRCSHCYLEASPDSTEEMPLSMLKKILDMLHENSGLTTINISGGSPELNPHYRFFIKAVTDLGRQVLTSTNLTIYSEPGMEDLPEFLAEHRVVVNASLPGYIEEEVDRIRGKGTYRKSIDAIKKLNELGYGKEGTALALNLLYTPAEAKISPDMKTLEQVYKEKLEDAHGITFNNLFTINNMPIGRFGKSLSEEKLNNYLKELEQNFNPDTLENLMCRTSISYDFNGEKAYDGDFWRIMEMPVKNRHCSINDFDYEALSSREIVTHPFCFMCTAGAGCACSDLLA